MARTRASDYESKQRNILNVAAAVFARVGIEKASMAQIARQGGSSKALLYHYYDSKDALIFDIVRTHLSDLEAAVMDADRIDLPADQRLRELILAVMEQYKDADDKHKVQLDCANSLSNEQNDALRRIERRVVQRFAAVLVEINPDLDDDRPLLMPVTMSLFGMLNWVYMWFQDDGPLSREEYARIVTSLFLDGVKTMRR